MKIDWKRKKNGGKVKNGRLRKKKIIKRRKRRT